MRLVYSESDRYYEGLCRPYLGEPLKSDLLILPNGEQGEGLASNKAFDEGDLVFRFYGKKVNTISLYTLEHPDGYHLLDPLVMGKVLHSCDPNMACDMTTQKFVALKPIKAGDWLTMDYNSTESTLFRPFQCQCGSENCKGYIAGYASDTQEKPLQEVV